jgi:hypothetical protein
MRCLDTCERKYLLDLLVEGELVHIVYARVDQKTGSSYCTIQPRKKFHGDESRTTDPARIEPCDPGELFTE